MKRRTVLRGLGVAGALGLAGCSENADPGDEGTPTATDETASPTETDEPTETVVTDEDDSTPPTATPTDTPTPTGSTPTATPTDSAPTTTPTLDDEIDDHEFSATQEGCGTEDGDADVSWDDGEGRVSISGTVWGSDLCSTALLDAAEVGDGALTVRLREGTTADPNEGCANCISEVSFESWFEVAGDLPDRVVVVYGRHGERTTIADESR